MNKPKLVGYFEVDGQTAIVETDIIGQPQEEYKRLLALVKAQHPKAVSIVRTGSTIKSGEPQQTVKVTPGQTLRQLFEVEGEKEPVRVIGSVIFSGTPTEIHLTFSNSAAVIRLSLKPLVGGASPIRFSNAINPQRLVSELPAILGEIFGPGAAKLEFFFEKVNA